MSPQRLATELMEHIVDMLGAGPREECLPGLLACSLANSALLNTSQKHIFGTVVMYSHSANLISWFIAPPPEIEEHCERTRQFLRTVADNARLSSYVRDVTCRFNDGSFCDNDFLHKVVRRLPNIVQFTIDVYNRPNSRYRGVVGVQVNQEGLNDIVELLRRPQLETLRLEPLAGFPLEVLRVARGLKALVLRDCGQSTIDNVIEVPAGDSLLVPQLETLTCDRTSLANIVNCAVIQGLSSPCLAQVSRLREINLVVYSEDVSNDIYGLLLQQVGNLKSFRLTVTDSTLTTPSDASGIFISPLLNLKTSSFSTLRHISLNILATFKPPADPAQRHFTIRDPFLGLCGSPLSNLTALETFRLDLTLDGNFDFNTYSFGPQWGVLSEMLAVPGAYPGLKEVGISVGIRVAGVTSSRDATINSTDPALNLLAKYFRHAVKPQFRQLEALHAGGMLGFFFEVGVWDGHRFAHAK